MSFVRSTLPMPAPDQPPTRAPRPLRRAALSSALALAGVLLLGAPAASAHVRVRPDSTVAGSYSALTFRVPNESDRARTTTVSVTLPQDTPFTAVSSKPVPGWRVTTSEAPLPKPVEVRGATLTKAVRTVTWTAADQAAGIAPGQYQEFSLVVGPLPASGTILLPATQTYSDGEVVRWDQPSSGGAEPEHPAPAFTVTAAGQTTPPTPVPADPAPAADPLARVIGGAGLGVGLIGVIIGVAGFRARRGATA